MKAKHHRIFKIIIKKNIHFEFKNYCLKNDLLLINNRIYVFFKSKALIINIIKYFYESFFKKHFKRLFIFYRLNKYYY